MCFLEKKSVFLNRLLTLADLYHLNNLILNTKLKVFHTDSYRLIETIDALASYCQLTQISWHAPYLHTFTIQPKIKMDEKDLKRHMFIVKHV